MTRSINDLPHRELRSAFINASSLGSNTLVAATGVGTKIVVVSLVVVAGASANSIKFLSGATEISALMALAGNGGVVLSENHSGWFSTGENQALNVNLSSATAIGINVNYYIVKS